jgi:hypothetical protein
MCAGGFAFASLASMLFASATHTADITGAGSTFAAPGRM